MLIFLWFMITSYTCGLHVYISNSKYDGTTFALYHIFGNALCRDVTWTANVLLPICNILVKKLLFRPITIAMITDEIIIIRSFLVYILLKFSQF